MSNVISILIAILTLSTVIYRDRQNKVADMRALAEKVMIWMERQSHDIERLKSIVEAQQKALHQMAIDKTEPVSTEDAVGRAVQKIKDYGA